MELSDEALIARCRRGEQEAWESLVARYQRLIFTIPRRAGLDESSAADVFQTVFAKLVEKLDDIEQPDRIQAWLVTAARRATYRILLARRSGRSSSDPDTDEVVALPDNAPLPDAEMLRLEQQQRLRAAVESLDDKCKRLLIELFYRAEPPPYSEIAAALGVVPGSIGPTRARCLQKLLKLVQKQGI